jgi:hypothetical protein
MSYYVHQVPGRLRVRIPLLRHQPVKCEQVVDTLAGRRGIHKIKVNPLTGSVVVNYDAAEIDEDIILNILEYEKLFDRTQAVTCVPRINQTATRAGKTVSRACFSYLVGKALESNGLGLLAAFI